MNKIAELPLSTYDLILTLLRYQLCAGAHFYSICVIRVLCRYIIVRGSVYTRGFPYSSLFLWQRGKDIRIECWHVSFPYMIWLFVYGSSPLCPDVQIVRWNVFIFDFHSSGQLYTGVLLFTLGLFLKWLFFDRGGRIYRKERACKFMSVILF